MNHSQRLCAVFAVLAIALTVLGAGAWALIPAAGCAASCVYMVWMMVRGSHHRTGHA